MAQRFWALLKKGKIYKVDQSKLYIKSWMDDCPKEEKPEVVEVIIKIKK